MTMGRPIAFFDFDGTLIRGDSLFLFLQQVRGTPRFVLDLIATSPWLGAYALRLVANDRAKEALLKQTLAGLPLDYLKEHGKRFAKQVIPKLLRAEIMDRLHHHQAQGHMCVLVSASLDLYLDPWGAANGFEYRLTSKLAMDDKGRTTGKLHGANCFGQEKVNRILDLLHRTGTPSRTYGYSDSTSDLPMLKLVDEAYLVGKRGIHPVNSLLLKS
ncbi:MAG: HAD-IB family hydrolase [Halothiobacillaceae bacterium]